MANVVLDVSSYPTIKTITDLVRSDVRDDMAGATNTVGEGQILVNDMTVSVTMANLFNSAVREICRKLLIVNAPMLIADNYIFANLPPMNGPLGMATADPSVQVYIGFNGYFDGTLWHTGPGNSWQLPQGVYQVLRVWERETGSNDIFNDLGEPSNGLDGIYQTEGFGRWEWRQDRIVLPGSLDNRDLRIRYNMILNALFVANANPATTYLPIMNCEEAIARTIDRLYSLRQGGAIYAERKAEADTAVFDLLNLQVTLKQGQNYSPQTYGDESPLVINYGQ